MKILFVIAGLAAIVSAPVRADIYECKDLNGILHYTNLKEEAIGCRLLNVSTPSSQLTALQKARDGARIGMTRQQALKAWGYPHRSTRTRTAAGSFEQWWYSESRTYDFTNGVLSAIHD